MTYDPNRTGPRRDSSMMWIIGVIAAIVVIGGLIWGMNRDETGTSSSASNPPGTSTSSTPSGSTSGAGSSSGTMGSGSSGSSNSGTSR